jgi:hypothetical protein
MVFTSEHKKRLIIESYFRNGIFNNEQWTYKRCCLFDRLLAKISKFKLKPIYATKNTSVHSRHLWTFVQNLKAFYDLSNC